MGIVRLPGGLFASSNSGNSASISINLELRLCDYHRHTAASEVFSVVKGFDMFHRAVVPSAGVVKKSLIHCIGHWEKLSFVRRWT